MTRLSLTDDSSASATFSGGFTFPFCGTTYSSLSVNSNGMLAFGGSTTSYSESASSFVTRSSAPRAVIGGLWDDLNAGSSSSTGVYTVQDGDAFTVYFRSVVEYGASTGNTFAFTLLADGRFFLDYGTVNVTDGLAGWSCGTGSTTSGASNYVAESDLSALRSALPAGANGIRTGSTHGVYEVFTSSDNDLDNQLFMFCPTNGTDADADGWTTECGDRDDADATVYPR